LHAGSSIFISLILDSGSCTSLNGHEELLLLRITSKSNDRWLDFNRLVFWGNKDDEVVRWFLRQEDFDICLDIVIDIMEGFDIESWFVGRSIGLVLILDDQDWVQNVKIF
jgi:hypothetical protein